MSTVLTLRRPKYYAMEPETHSGYTYGIEKSTAIISQLRANAEAHWEETEVLYRQPHGEPNWPAYAALEESGKFVIFTARDTQQGSLVGHLAFYVYESMHTLGVMEAREDAFFVTRDHRKSRVGLRLYKYAEKCLQIMDVGQVSMSCKSPAGGPDLDKFLRRQGFLPVAIGYYKTLEVDTDGDV